MSFGIFEYLSTLSNIATEEGFSLRDGLINSVQKRLFPYEKRSIPKLATLLDPHFKKEGFRSHENVMSGLSLLEKEMYNILPPAPHPELPTAVNKPSTRTSLFSFVQERIADKSKSALKDVILTKRQYIERPNLDEATDTLAFWKVSLKC